MTPLLSLAVVSAAIIAIIVLIARYRLNPFIVLMSVSLLVALIAGIPLPKVVTSFETGVGHVLSHIATVIALGTMLGKMLAESGGADRITLTVTRLFGEKNVSWAMMVIGLLVGLPVFFEVGFVLLIPLAYTLARRTNTPLLRVALPMAASLSVVHAMIPPHPGALLAVSAYHANTGITIFWGLIIGIPTAILAGPVYARFITPHIPEPVQTEVEKQFVNSRPPEQLPSFSITIFTILAPVFLMLLGAVADLLAPPQTTANIILHFLGNTDIALMLAVILSFYVLGLARGFSRATILHFTNECLAPTALIMLLVGAGGGLGNVLIESKLSHDITSLAIGAHVPLIVLAWLIAVVMRLAAGSATVAMSTASAIVGPMLLQAPEVSPALMVIATGAGSVAVGAMNDGGFWQMKEYLGLTVPQTIKTWCVTETLISVLGLIFCLILSPFAH